MSEADDTRGDAYTQLRSIAVEMKRLLEHGCSDHHCRMVKRPRGMGTNGGCKCIRHFMDLSECGVRDADAVRHIVGNALPVMP